MSQNYQNEKSPIVYGVKKPKTLRKVQKMTVTSLRNLQDVSEHPVNIQIHLVTKLTFGFIDQLI